MNQGPMDLETRIASLTLLDHHNVDWKRVQRTAYLIHQYLRYEYPCPIYDLKQCLMIIPQEYHGDQRRIVHRLEVSVPPLEISEKQDLESLIYVVVHLCSGGRLFSLENLKTEIEKDGPLICKWKASAFFKHVEKAIDFEAWILVERYADESPQRTSARWLTDPRLLQPSSLTQPDQALHQVAATLMAEGHQGVALARRINAWVYHTLQYTHDVTDIHTPAAEALALGQGVCQDYAHIMLALCRLCGLPAYYVSGHLLGEGGTHAWVEVLVPSADRADEVEIWPFDPTHGCEAGLNYLTIAIGRDYHDVAPTSGTFRAPKRGELSARKRVGLMVLEYGDVGEGE